MCRLFGFRSIIPSQVHRSLMAADNALGAQSRAHPDGWGVAHYVDGCPHVVRSADTALNDVLFHRLSGVVASETVVAHVRKATQGTTSVLNCHPFQFGRWSFAHNGDVANFKDCRAALVQLILPRLRRYILGDTDSEVIFLCILSELSGRGPLSQRHGVAAVADACRRAVKKIRAITDTAAAEKPALLTFVLTDGMTFVAHQGGKELYYSTYKTRCSDRDECPHLGDACEAPSVTGFINHLVITSEVIEGENVFAALAPGEIVGVDWRMRLLRSDGTRRTLDVAASAG